LTPIAERATDN